MAHCEAWEAALELGATGLFRIREGRFRHDMGMGEAALYFRPAPAQGRLGTGCCAEAV